MDHVPFLFKQNRRKPYRDTEVIKEHIGDKLVRVVVLVRWEQSTPKVIVDIRKFSHVVRET